MFKEISGKITKINKCWTFHCVNDNKEIDVKFLQTMKSIFCHNSQM
jgi:hypothetical protein